MTDLFLGLIALAVVVMASIQVGALIVAARVAKRMERLATQVEQDLKPIFANLESLSSEAARAAGLAALQVERADRLFAEVSDRVEQVSAMVQSRILGPVTSGSALLAGLRAALLGFRGPRRARRRSSTVDDDDALFIG